MKSLLDAFVAAAVKTLNLGGFQGWLAGLAIRLGIKELGKWLEQQYIYIKGFFASKKFEQEIKKDEGREERKKDEGDFLNS